MEAWDAEQLTMWVVVLRADFLAIWQGDVARIARDSEISAAASVRFFYVKPIVLVCYISFCCISDLNRFKNNYS
jgi:Mn2+/Fe2+ NRAMP family transporter